MSTIQVMNGSKEDFRFDWHSVPYTLYAGQAIVMDIQIGRHAITISNGEIFEVKDDEEKETPKKSVEMKGLNRVRSK